MQSPETIATHAYFGQVTADGWDLIFHPPDNRSDVVYRAGYVCHPTREHYEALLPRLPAFEAFCRNLEENDRRVRQHFRSWPLTAGAFELVCAMMGGDDELLPSSLTPYPYDQRPFALQYRALDQAAWEFAGIPWWPPVFAALFDATGNFSGIEYQVEQAMRDLPDSIAPSRWEAGYRHPYFGRRKLSDFSRLTTSTVAGRKIPFDLFMTKKTMAAFEPEHLDPFVSLVEKLDGLDAGVRSGFPEAMRMEWLEERFTYGTPTLRRALDQIFPDATDPSAVSPQAFAAALVLKRGCFSLSPEKSGGAALTLDYAILPARNDNELFAAKFSLDGELLDLVIES